MKKFYFKKIAAIVLCVTINPLFSQKTFEYLTKVENVSETVYVSQGHEKLGRHLASLVEGANQYMSELVGMTAPETTILILSQEDWGKYANPQLIYGMPHYSGQSANTLVVAAEDNAFWRANMPPVDQLSSEHQLLFKKVYTNEDGELSSRPFFDLLVLHELGHGWTGHHGIKHQRFWLEEVFVNVFLHTYIAEKQPHLLPALEVLPMVNATGEKGQFQYTTLAQFEEGYWIIGREAPVNYGWYQFRFHYAAKLVYDHSGATALKNLWKYYAGLSDVVNDETLLNGLHSKVHPAMADVYRKWDN